MIALPVIYSMSGCRYEPRDGATPRSRINDESEYGAPVSARMNDRSGQTTMKVPPHIKAFWDDFLRTDFGRTGGDRTFEGSFQIGSNKDEADEGAKLILTGEKTATSSLLWTLEANGEPPPKLGGLYVVEGGSGAPTAVIRTLWVEALRFADIDAQFARDYAECDGTLEGWYRVFGAYYAEECAAMQRELTGETPWFVSASKSFILSSRRARTGSPNPPPETD